MKFLFKFDEKKTERYSYEKNIKEYMKVKIINTHFSFSDYDSLRVSIFSYRYRMIRDINAYQREDTVCVVSTNDYLINKEKVKIDEVKRN